MSLAGTKQTERQYLDDLLGVEFAQHYTRTTISFKNTQSITADFPPGVCVHVDGSDHAPCLSSDAGVGILTTMIKDLAAGATRKATMLNLGPATVVKELLLQDNGSDALEAAGTTVTNGIAALNPKIKFISRPTQNEVGGTQPASV